MDKKILKWGKSVKKKIYGNVSESRFILLVLFICHLAQS